MKKKLLKRLLIIAGIILGVYYFILFPTGWFVIYHKTPSYANEPGLPLNSRMISTNLKESKVLDFIVFSHRDAIMGDGQRVFRLMGIENDTIQIKDGILYKNGDNLDVDLDLMKNYVIDKKQFDSLRSTRTFDEENFHTIYMDNQNYFISLKDSDTIIKYWSLKRNLVGSTEYDEEIQKRYNENWSMNNFGPLVIPKNKLFVLGDNRDNCYDSRFIGLIDKENLKGTIIAVF